jgi:hypothetical protein
MDGLPKGSVSITHSADLDQAGISQIEAITPSGDFRLLALELIPWVGGNSSDPMTSGQARSAAADLIRAADMLDQLTAGVTA